MSTKKPIKFELRRVYGRDLFYPMTEAARKLCRVADKRRTTLSPYHVRMLKAAGIEMKLVRKVAKSD